MKNKKLILTLFLTLISGLLSAQAPTNGLVAYYPFNNSAEDLSGNNFDGTVSGATPTVDRFGKPNSAYDFDGLSNFITLPNSFDINPRSISVWFMATELNTSHRYVWVSDNPSLNYGLTYIDAIVINGDTKAIISISDVADTVDIIENIWYNISITINNLKVVKFYLNGALSNTKNYNANLKSVNGLTKVVLGSSRTSGNQFFQGSIDDIRIYDRELSANEVLAIYQDPKTDVQITEYSNSISIYPNPSRNYIYFSLSGEKSNNSGHVISIINPLGQKIFSEKTDNINGFSLDLSAYSSTGLHTITITSSEGAIIQNSRLFLN